MAPVSPLRQLADIISASVDKIEAQLLQEQTNYPNLDDPFDPTSPAEAAAVKPDIADAAFLIVSACGQLSAALGNPALTLWATAGGFHVASSMRVALESNTVEILREAGPQGLHSRDICARNGLDPVKFSRILRLLATHHIFREISPDVFTNNRLSSMMDTLKPVSEIMANPDDKHAGTSGMSALMNHTTDEVFKSSAFMTEALLDPVTGHSDTPEHIPMGLAFKTDKPWWKWYEEPGNERRLKRFGAAMEGTTKTDAPKAILKGFDWSTLAPQSIVVDVGGGIGSTTIQIAKRYPNLQFIVQDRPAVVEQGKIYWMNGLPHALENGSVKLQAHDFLTPQPVRNASVFLLRMIMHDYGRENAVKILTQLREAATPDTILLIVDRIISYACQNESSQVSSHEIPGAAQPDAPKPLLSNFGKANATAYILDLQMYVALNGEERTLGSFLEVTQSSGWKIKQVYTIPGSSQSQLLAVPC